MGPLEGDGRASWGWGSEGGWSRAASLPSTTLNIDQGNILDWSVALNLAEDALVWWVVVWVRVSTWKSVVRTVHFGSCRAIRKEYLRKVSSVLDTTNGGLTNVTVTGNWGSEVGNGSNDRGEESSLHLEEVELM